MYTDTDTNNKPLLLLFTGAGFSAHAGAPLMKDFLDKAREATALIDDPVYERIRAGFYFTDYATRAEPNLETAYGAAVFRQVIYGSQSRVATITRNEKFIKSHLGPRLEDVIDGFERAIAVLYGRNVLDGQSGWLPYYCRFFEYLSTRYRLGIISTNYDLISETALQEIGLATLYLLPHLWVTAKVVPVLKLHGSVNWPRMDRLNLRDIQTNEQPRERAFVLPPTWNKDIGTDSVFGRIWADAIDLIRSADGILVVGQSFPNTDLHLDYLFAEGLAKQQDRSRKVRVTIADLKPDSVGERFRRYQAVECVSAHVIGFEHLLDELEEDRIGL